MATYDGDDMTISPWVFEHGRQIPAVLVAECGAPDVWILGSVLTDAGFEHPARVGVRPPTVPGWQAAFRLSPPELTITHDNGVQFYTGELPRLPERWAYSARELKWCVLYVVLGLLPKRVDPYADLHELVTASRNGIVYAGRVAIHEAGQE